MTFSLKLTVGSWKSMVGSEEISFLGIKWYLVGFYTSHLQPSKKQTRFLHHPIVKWKVLYPTNLRKTSSSKPKKPWGVFFAESSRECSIFSGPFRVEYMWTNFLVEFEPPQIWNNAFVGGRSTAQLWLPRPVSVSSAWVVWWNNFPETFSPHESRDKDSRTKRNIEKQRQ